MRNDLSVNLLPNELRLKRENQKKFSRSIFILIIVILTFMGLNIIIITINYSYALEGDGLRSDIAQVDTEVSQLKTAEDNLKELSYKFINSDKIIQSSLSAEEVINQISQSTPKNITLTSIDIDLNKDPQVLVQGKAVDRRDVVVFVEAINGNKTFSNAQTTGVANATDNSAGVTFSVTIIIKEDK